MLFFLSATAFMSADGRIVPQLKHSTRQEKEIDPQEGHAQSPSLEYSGEKPGRAEEAEVEKGENRVKEL